MSRFAVIEGESRSIAPFRGHFLEGVRSAGHEVHVFAPSDAGAAAWLEKRNIQFHPIDFERAAISPLADVRLAWRLHQELRTLGPDLVLTTTIKPTVYGVPSARTAGVPRRFALITGLGYAFTAGNRNAFRRLTGAVARSLYRASLRFATGAIFHNSDDRDEFRRLGLLGATPAMVINGSGVNLEDFLPAPLPDEPRFLLIARLLRDKGLAEYLAAASVVKQVRPAARFDLVGPTDSNPSAFPIEEVRAAVSAGTVAYHGSVDDVRPFIAAARIYVLPSYREGTSRAMLEAMAMGRPVVTTDVPGCRTTVAEGDNGLLVPARDAGALAEAMIRMIDHPDEAARMGRRSRAIAEERYDVRAVSADLMNILGL
jgi:glycosyltransferase involved in cell wall biosynthesis